jgi:hypothetical protein
MPKTRIDLASLEIPSAAQKPLYAAAGAGDLAVATVKTYVADVTKRVTGYQKDAQTRVAGVQKSVASFDARTIGTSALDAAKARRAQVEARVAELQAEATALPGRVQAALESNVTTVTGAFATTYADLAKRGEAVVKGAPEATVAVEAVVETPAKKAAKKPTATKPAAKKAPAKKAAAKKTTAKKAPATKATTKAATKAAEKPSETPAEKKADTEA